MECVKNIKHLQQAKEMKKIFVQIEDFYKLTPFNFQAIEFIKKFGIGVILEISAKKARNPKFHRKAMALFNVGFQNCKWNPPSFNFYRRYITKKAGHYESSKVNGEWEFQSKSLAFDEMDDIEFEQVYNDVLQEIILDTKADQEFIEKNLSSFF